MSTTYHEPVSELSLESREVHRAVASLIEELEAVDWYHQRVNVCQDEELKAILVHNRDEEIEHAALALEWLRRRIPQFDQKLRSYLFTSAPITHIEEQDETSTARFAKGAPSSGDPGISGLKRG
jgi:ferritin-like protein